MKSAWAQTLARGCQCEKSLFSDAKSGFAKMSTDVIL